MYTSCNHTSLLAFLAEGEQKSPLALRHAWREPVKEPFSI